MNKKTVETVGFVGLGNMGAGIVANILNAGYDVVVHDKRDGVAMGIVKRGAQLAHSPAEVARLCDVTFTSLPGPSEVESVALSRDGIVHGITKGAVYVDLSTSRPELIRRIEPLFRAKGADVLDAPVSGGKVGAESGTLAVMVGGSREVYEKVKPILDTFGDKVFYAGGIGAGSVCKLVHNLISTGVRQVIAEGLTLGVKAGVQPLELWECIRRGAVGRLHDLHETLPHTMFRGEFEPATFMLTLLHKDIGLATDLARTYNVPLPLGSLVEQMVMEAVNRGWGEMDSSVIVRLQEEAAGVEVRTRHIDLARAAAFVSIDAEA